MREHLTALLLVALWILWQEVGDLGKEGEWTYKDAFQTKQECETNREGYYIGVESGFNKVDGFVAQRLNEMILIVDKNSKKIIKSSFKCIPESIDPRQPKR